MTFVSRSHERVAVLARAICLQLGSPCLGLVGVMQKTREKETGLLNIHCLTRGPARVICLSRKRIILSAIWWQFTRFRRDQDGYD